MKKHILQVLLIFLVLTVRFQCQHTEKEEEITDNTQNHSSQDSPQDISEGEIDTRNSDQDQNYNQGDFIDEKQENQGTQQASNEYISQEILTNQEDEVHIDIDMYQNDQKAHDQINQQKQENQQKIDIIALEIQQLQSLIELHKSKLTLLSNLRENMIKNNVTFQEFNTTQLKKKVQPNQNVVNNKQDPTAEQKEESISSKINNIYMTNTQKMKLKPQKLIEFQQYTFSNRVDKKLTVKCPQKIRKLKNLQTFQYQTNNGIKANLMMVSLTIDSTILVHDFSGELATDPYTPGHQIHLIALSQRSDDVFVATIGDDQNLRMARIDNQKVKSQFAEGNNQFRYKIKTDLFFPLNSFSSTIDISKQVTSFEYLQFQSFKIFLLGDYEGNLHMYYKNGTFISKESLSSQNLPILSLQKMNAPSILYYTDKEIGFFNLNTLQKFPFSCQLDDYEILKVKLDPYISSILYVLTKQQQLLAYEYKVMEQFCKLKEVFDFETQIQVEEDEQFNINKQPAYYNQLVPIKNFVVLVSYQANKIRVLNTTDIFVDGIQDGFDFNHLKLFENLNTTTDDSIQFIYQQKIYQGNYIVAGYYHNKGESTTYSLYEIIAPLSKEYDYLSYIRGPLIITVIIGIISFQIYKNYQKKKMYKNNKNDYSNFKKDLDISQKFKKSNGAKNSDNNNNQQINQYKDKISQLEESTSQLLKNTQKLEQKQPSIQKRKNYDDVEDDDFDFRNFNQKNKYENDKQKNNNNYKYNQIEDEDDDDQIDQYD
ncbi:transmembrane protein, putative (macronuclear) [Tetrahymena thermophila SB210]|uniref:Transmembrane protein, putative n=1 Tax=Tetrahymena thermophila (strain SB210) TaxID=312017 RepID=I7MGP9_TETTS|nr:transmembrane protein, putative [Tetrahymena thermophila SB210]EAS01804.2 transmembrane protein, putative [Tetrahymena thermophila SB210]|eukprot:XP_001022049.2 transmembrane protein, putative [Tetrahymena thermophila SB210]